MRRHFAFLALGLAAAVPLGASAGHRDIAVSVSVPGLTVSYGQPGWGVAAPVYYAPERIYYAPAPVYYPPAPVYRPAPVVVYPRHVHYAPPVRHVVPRAVVVVPRYGHHEGHRHHGRWDRSSPGHWR